MRSSLSSRMRMVFMLGIECRGACRDSSCKCWKSHSKPCGDGLSGRVLHDNLASPVRRLEKRFQRRPVCFRHGESDKPHPIRRGHELACGSPNLRNVETERQCIGWVFLQVVLLVRKNDQRRFGPVGINPMAVTKDELFVCDRDCLHRIGYEVVVLAAAMSVHAIETD